MARFISARSVPGSPVRVARVTMAENMPSTMPVAVEISWRPACGLRSARMATSRSRNWSSAWSMTSRSGAETRA